MSDDIQKTTMVNMIDILKRMGINDSQLSRENVAKILDITNSIHNINDITPEIADKILNILGIDLTNPQHRTSSNKIKRN